MSIEQEKNRVTIATNVLISVTFWHGDSEKIIDKVENKEIILVLSEEILEEYNRVLEYDEIKQKVKNKNLEMKKALTKITIISEIVDVRTKVNLVKDDPNDNKIIECAIDGKANFIITKDEHLLKIKEHNNIKILTPEEFLKI